MLESYTFTVHYNTTEDGQRRPSGVTSRPSKQPEGTLEHMNVALQELLRSISALCDEMPTLPGESSTTSTSRRLTDLAIASRVLSMNLIYDMEGKVEERHAMGFVTSTDDSLLLAEAAGWQTYTKSLDFASGLHG